ncbi:ABC transporter ATP-binding protein [Rhodalgimonas zhirmunskyi]|uniref:ABC transporter ATP-binding protein n=1 Tax=Rhodalgimonas zhirmunskyi TaxID=2964767 RepID=A0AAJ1U931_9RHOB|nr:ABC transporter ATP-binding protein [Rhodoalgimonas zhirmunskyi]MDQ2093403.1 ABC transporter ATP-binding protein [Rhodoalgimonas zhirmunskyi]
MIEANDITVRFGTAEALRGINLTLSPGQRLGIVGESGSGKSMLGLSLMGMLPDAAGMSGQIRIDGTDMTGAKIASWRAIRARKVAMIFQEPLAALNPLRRVGNTVMEPLRQHLGHSKDAARARVLQLFEETGIQDPVAKFRQFPHELSGGQRQRVLISLALACNPKVLIADEPTTALDAHVALRITDLLVRLAEERGMALVFISHDLAAVARTAQDIAVMYGGEIVERGPVHAVLSSPHHPYTQGLLLARPALGAGHLRERLPVIPGTVPAMRDLAVGCRFSGRCAVELPHCATERPASRPVGAHHDAACHRIGAAT